ncbi:hypothetical protein [Bradyrhizobium sp. CCBAU 53415]|uniref:hypothetical protein n=1 Tax=Bradyrhizobium sp. CCBAU 53415 TaxID=1325119 RepID=UPI003FA442E2
MLTRSFALVGGPPRRRIGYTWEAVPGLSFFGQYATGADIAANTAGSDPAARPDHRHHWSLFAARLSV